jgi:hypothetical protein
MPPEVIRVALGSVALKPSAGARLLSRTALGVHVHESTQTSERKERVQETLDALSCVLPCVARGFKRHSMPYLQRMELCFKGRTGFKRY